MKIRHILIILTAVFMSGCAAKTSLNWDRAVTDKPQIALSVPFYPQKAYNCGPAALAMALDDKGLSVTPDELVSAVYTPSKKGTLQPDMLQGARRYGKIPYPVSSPDELMNELAQDRPVVVFLNLGLSWHPVWHYAVVTGISPRDGLVFMHSGTKKNEAVKAATFDHIWGRAGYWGFVTLNPGEIPMDASPVKLIDSVNALESAGKRPEALKAYEAAYAKWPEDRLVLFAYANSLYFKGDKERAAELLTKLTSLYPQDADAWNNLAQILHELGRKDEAVKAAETAVNIGGDRVNDYKQTLSDIK